MRSAALTLASSISIKRATTWKKLYYWIPCWISCFPNPSYSLLSAHLAGCFHQCPLEASNYLIKNFHTSTMAPRAAKAMSPEEDSPPKNRKRAIKTADSSSDDDAPSPKKRTTKKKKAKEASDASPKQKTTKKKSAAKKSKVSTSPKSESPKTVEKASPETAKKKKKAPAHQVLTERDELPKLWEGTSDSHTFKIASWNVAGLRAILKKKPEAFADLAAKHDLDILCLQETKLQEQHLDDPKLKIKELMGLDDDYEGYWTCSTAKKGYAGTAVFVRKRSKKGAKQATLDTFFGAKEKNPKTNSTLAIDPQLLVPQSVSYKMGKDQHDAEGRLIMVDLPLFSFCNVYTPNSGQKLERLTYRTSAWDKDFLACMQEKQKERGLPVLWLGDLNVAHTNLEVWNDGAKHLPKQAGVTPQERASFQEQLDAGFIDAFRHLHPTAAGHYSYWSARAGNRAPNKGLRLDYFICDPTLFDESSQVIVRDSYMDFDQEGSDHCPVILEMEIKPNGPTAH